MSESIFIADGERFLPTEHARGPWDPRALHGGAPAALITAAFERLQPGAELPIGRLSFELLRPVPMAPLTLQTRIVRPGRRVQELAAELLADGETIARAAALRVQAVPEDAAQAAAPAGELGAAMPPVAELEPLDFALDSSSQASFAATAMEMRASKDVSTLGPGRVWMRLRHPLLPGEPLTPLARLAATADFGNGISAALPFDRFLFINADLTVHLLRPPEGEWIGLDARTRLLAGGTGVAESVLHDERGAVGRAFQTLVVQPR
ncbi:MAG TPA: thioesterase family protein [Solirubrobacteraceae bacterium]|jgi:acyl-coenzyme A thioesterase PaaI-like protein|nr:thioesterase family protein [Solirubrobacteraceae bacterium]